MRRKSAISLVLLYILFVPDAFGQDYIVHVDEDHPLSAEVVLQLPRGNGKPRRLSLRGLKWGLQSQVSAVRGENSALENLDKGKWIVPADCKTVRWTIHFQDSALGPVKASAQKNVYFRNGKWWLISEPTSLVRLDGAIDDAFLAIKPDKLSQIGAMPCQHGSWRIPAPNRAPEFFVVGHVKPREVDVDGFRIIHVADDVQRFNALGLETAHVSAFRYLRKLFPQSADLPKSQKRLLVVWIGIDAAEHHLGGAAGGRSLLANYVHEKSKDSADYAASNLMVVAHEQFHQLDGLCNQDHDSPPVWVNESLAQYFGIKAISKSTLPQSCIQKARERFIDTDRAVDQGLAKLSRRFKQGDRRVYPLFYSQGATFWAEVDQAISVATDGNKSLDDFLPVLLHSKYDDSGTLPEAVQCTLRAVIGERINILTRRYVGS